ncbi:hypothetical protein DFH06DRAFT_1327230 [Mycena polygramma]|nr:hypothetical protein DFH06DRAFT_1327230 [Mycena polygramma]
MMGLITSVEVFGELFRSLTLPLLNTFIVGPGQHPRAPLVFPSSDFLQLAHRSSFHSHLTQLLIDAVISDLDLLRYLAFLSSRKRAGHPSFETHVEGYPYLDESSEDDALYDPYREDDVYDDRDISLDVVAGHRSSGGASIAANFAVDTEGGITRSGDAEASEANSVAVVLGRQ